MVRWIRTAYIGGGKFGEAIGWAKEMAAYGEKKYGIAKIQVFIDSFGTAGTIRWMVDYPNLAAVEKVQQQIMTDADYWKRVGQAMTSGIFLEGRTEDVVTSEV